MFVYISNCLYSAICSYSDVCLYSGEDLNRRWQDPNAKLHPVIYHTKGLMSYVRQVLNKEIFLFCDFHGHSRKKNVFLYGCSSLQSWWPPDLEFIDDPMVYKVNTFIMYPKYISNMFKCIQNMQNVIKIQSKNSRNTVEILQKYVYQINNTFQKNM